METKSRTIITVQTTVNADIDKVWNYYTLPAHIVNWAYASDDWHAPYAENDPVTGGRFKTTMAAKDGSFSFDFSGTYTNVQAPRLIEYTLDDDRKVRIVFSTEGNQTKLVSDFEAEDQNSIELQQGGWQAILDNFKKYTEGN